MSWKKIESAIHEFSDSLDSEVHSEKTHSIGVQIEYFKFTDKEGLDYEFKLSKPVLEYGSRLRIESDSGEEKIDIVSSSQFFGKPRLQINSGTISETAKEKLLKVQKLIETFSWKTREKLIFMTRTPNYNLETLKLIREVHLEIKNTNHNIN